MSLALEKNFDYFLQANFDNYKDGEWIAIYEKQVIAHGTTLKNVIGSVKE